MKKIFRKELFIKHCEKTGDINDHVNQLCLETWVTDCDGKEVVDSQCLGVYSILNEWCEIVEE